MATWQCGFLVVPRGLATGRTVSWHAEPAEVRYDGGTLTALRKAADETLGRSRGWSSEVEMWGQDASTCMHMVHEGEDVVEIYLRVDVRSPGEENLRALLQAMSRMDLVLVGDDEKIWEPTPESLHVALVQSSASAFVGDPEGYLSSRRGSD